MHRRALRGYSLQDDRLTPAESVEVMKLIVEESRRLHRSLDLRLLVNCFQVRLQAELGEAGCDWKDLVVSRIRMVPSVMAPITSRGVRVQMKEKELAIVRGLVKLSRERRLHEWSRQTGKSEPSLYRRLKELGLMDSAG